MKLKTIEVIPIEVPINEKVRIRDSYGWKTASRYNIVRAISDDGIIGFGEATFTDVWSGERQAGSKEVIENVLLPALQGTDIFRINEAVRKMDLAIFGHPASKAAVEMALFDMAGKRLNTPLYNLLGGKIRDSLPIKFSISAVDDESILKMVEFALEKGITTVKIKVGTGMKKDIERVRTIHKHFGDRLRIAVDANNAWRLDEAKRILDQIAPFHPLFIEQPLSRDDLTGMRELRQFTSIPIVIDEGVFTPEQAWNALRENAADVYSVYPGKNAGILKTNQILNLVKSAKKIGLLGSNLELGIASAAMTHIGLSNESIDDLTFPSDIIGPLYHVNDILKKDLIYRDGCIWAPDGPGLGVEPDEEKLQFYKII